MIASCKMLDPDCFEYYPRFLGLPDADRICRTLWRDLSWSQQEITIFGRRVMQPRLTAWYGDPSAVYSYSGLKLAPSVWHSELLTLKSRLEEFTGCAFNFVLANAYRDGNDSMGWHQDNEPELGDRPCIASLSLGAARRFLLKPVRPAVEGPSRSSGLTLDHGSLLIMLGDSQRKYKHSLPKTRRAIGLRINLTFREIRPR